MISRYVITIEQIEPPDRGWKVHLIGPDRKPATMMGTEITWPLNAVVDHIKAQVEGSDRPNDSALWAYEHGGGAYRADGS